jgi:hypothetical protein
MWSSSALRVQELTHNTPQIDPTATASVCRADDADQRVAAQALANVI